MKIKNILVIIVMIIPVFSIAQDPYISPSKVHRKNEKMDTVFLENIYRDTNGIITCVDTSMYFTKITKDKWRGYYADGSFEEGKFMREKKITFPVIRLFSSYLKTLVVQVGEWEKYNKDGVLESYKLRDRRGRLLKFIKYDKNGHEIYVEENQFKW